ARRHDVRTRAGVLSHRSLLLSVAARSDKRRTDTLRRETAERTGARGSILRRHPRSGDGVHVGNRERAVQGRRAGKDPPQRVRAVNKWQGLLRAAIASAGNDHRLGANEAPPAIISVFLGDMLTEIFEQIEKGSARSTRHGGELDTGVLVLPKLPRDAGDRNRTSPFAFTGNKFEFRAVSSNQSIAYPNIALNLAVTESLDYMASELEKAMKGGKTLAQAVTELLPKVIKENKRIILNGNGYTAEREKEAGKRGL